MKRSWFRSALFNLAFLIATAILCVLYIPALLLPRVVFTGLVRFWISVVTVLEYLILDLKYEVRGKEFLPKTGSYIVAAKHQSAYETIKLRTLFRDPAIILKKELLSIPLWGQYLKKSGVIAIDRSTPERAVRSIEEGALKMKEDGRPIIIFVQGTRVWPEETTVDKPYKAGVSRIQSATDLPIIPMALNTGLFWPRKGWLKSPGCVIFEFFEPIPPGKDKKELLKILEDKIETESNRLMNESRAVELNRKSSPLKIFIIWLAIFTAFCAGYSYAWKEAARRVVEVYVALVKDVVEVERIHSEPVITGYPGPIKLTVANESIRSAQGSVNVDNLIMTGWPIPFTPVHIQSGTITAKSFRWPEALIFDSFEASVTYWNQKIKIHDSALIQGEFESGATGTIDIGPEPYPDFDLTLNMKNYGPFIAHLAQLGILKSQEALFTTAGLNMLAVNGEVNLPITRNGSTLYAGPLPVASLPVSSRQAPDNPPAPDQ